MSGPADAATDDWWREAFGEGYAEVYAHRDEAQAAAEVADLLHRAGPLVGPVLDAACGGGRHLAALRAAGLAAFGFDWSSPLLATARQRTGLAGRLARGDLRAPPLAPGGWGAVLLLFTAFGYFGDAADRACLTALGRLLRPDGRLVLDLPDPAAVAAGLVPETRRITAGGWRVVERRRISGERIEKTVVAAAPDGRERTWRESVRLYRSDELPTLAAAAGLRLVHCDGGLAGAAGRQVAWLRPAS
jgi:SAM-dependent methyltransferase